MVGEKRTRHIASLAGLWYLLASTYLVARLLSNRIVIGVWGLDAELLVETGMIPLTQLGFVQLLRLGRSARSARCERVSERPGMGDA